MSFFGPADSPAAYADDLFSGRSGGGGCSLSRLNSSKQLYSFSPEAYYDDSYGEMLFANGDVEMPTKNAGGEMELDENDLRLRLQEIEHALLDDTDDLLAGLCADGSDMSIKSFLLSDSSKESSLSSDSTATTSAASSSIGGEDAPLKQLLFDCAGAVAAGRLDDATKMIAELRQSVAVQGEPEQRLAAYLVEGLVARLSTSGSGIYRSLRCKEQPSSYQLSAMQILFEVCPCFRFGFTAANYAIIDAGRGEDTVHIVDFDINQGSQYFTLIQSLSSHASRPRRLRITGVDDPETVQRAVGGLRVVGERLEKLAEDCGIPFEFRAVAASTGDVVPAMLDCRPGEALVVNFAFQLHHLPDESVSTVNQRDRLLRMVKGLQPKLVTVVEQDASTNTAPFLARYAEVYSYYSALFDSLDATMPRESAERMMVERQCLAREIVNILACEGADRIERYEVAGKWRARMTMAGFVPCPFNGSVVAGIQSLLKTYCNRYKFAEESAGLQFGWGEKTLVVASAWR